MIAATKTCLTGYFTFSGRASRSEFWWFFLFAVIVFGGLLALDGAIFEVDLASRTRKCLFAPLFGLAIVLPMLTAGWRRMHDVGKPGWYLLLPVFVSFATLAFILMVFMEIVTFHDADADRKLGSAYFVGYFGVILTGLVQLVIALFLLWRLTRPSDVGANKYGPPHPP